MSEKKIKDHTEFSVLPKSYISSNDQLLIHDHVGVSVGTDIHNLGTKKLSFEGLRDNRILSNTYNTRFNTLKTNSNKYILPQIQLGSVQSMFADNTQQIINLPIEMKFKRSNIIDGTDIIISSKFRHYIFITRKDHTIPTDRHFLGFYLDVVILNKEIGYINGKNYQSMYDNETNGPSIIRLDEIPIQTAIPIIFSSSGSFNHAYLYITKTVDSTFNIFNLKLRLDHTHTNSTINFNEEFEIKVRSERTDIEVIYGTI